MKKVLLLNQTFYPDNAATGQQLTDLGIALLRNGFRVTAIADQRSYDDRKRIHPRYEKYNGIDIIRVKSSGYGKQTKIFRFLDYLTFTAKLIIRLLRLSRYDIVISLTSPPWIGFVATLYGRLRGSKVIYWIMDINPDEIEVLGWTKHNSLTYRIIDWMNCFAYKKCDIAVLLDKYMAERIQRKSVSVKRMDIIPPWSHDEDIYYDISMAENPFRKKFRLNGKFIVMYAGNFSICHPLETLLHAARELRDNNNLVFLFVGGGVRSGEIVEFKNLNRLNNIILAPYQPRDQIKYSLSAADLHVISMGEKFVGISHPCKIYGILATGKPYVLVGPSKCHVTDIMNDSRCAYRVAHGKVDDLIKIIKKVQALGEEEKLQACEMNRQLVRDLFSMKKVSQLMIDICFELIGE